LERANTYGVTVKDYLDFGCASGRVLRHFAIQHPEIRSIGCDINRLHVEWCNTYLPDNCTTFQNHAIPSLPLEDSSLDLISAFSVFTHIESLETTWLMEIKRVLRPGGLAWITVHTEHTLQEMTEDWPLWKPVMKHRQSRKLLDSRRNFKGNRLVLRLLENRSYASNVFYKLDYLKEHWSRIFDIVEVLRRFPTFQDVLILRKRP
jgi:SAM-dependent methyltransferase